jgi:tryptophan synthase alpha chain
LSAIDQVFARCAAEGRAAFIPFLMAGDPDLATTETLLEALAAAGADMIELGVPFSDPIADGPVNQRAAARALAAGTKLSGVFHLVAATRDRLGVPIVLFTYFNPIHARGLELFAEQAATSGVDGVLCVDLPPEEARAEYVPALAAHGIDAVFLLAPTSTRERIHLVGRHATGFVYYVSRTGVTGERDALPPDLAREVRRVRRKLEQPVAVGFGVSTPAQVAALGEVADGVVVGSALVRLVEELGGDPSLPSALERRARELAAPLKRGAERRRA